VRDVDLDAAKVYIAGGAKTAPRWGTLTDWGLVQVARHLTRLKRDSTEVPLLCSNSKSRTSARASAYDAIRTTIERAGLGQEPDVRPNSLVAWRGAAALAEGSSIDEVARLLGIRSLDAAAAFIGWDWRRKEP
jgi:integrase/recombinase XerC